MISGIRCNSVIKLLEGYSKANGFLISGTCTPGIGKSCFVDFCLRNLLELDESVRYFYGMTNYATIYKTDGTVETYTIHDNFLALAKQVDFLFIDSSRKWQRRLSRWTELGKKVLYYRFLFRSQQLQEDNSSMSLYGDLCTRRDRKDKGSLLSKSTKRASKEFGDIARALFKVVDIEDGVDTNLLDNIWRDQRAPLIDVVATPNRIEYLENSNDILWTVFHMEHLFHCTR